MKYNYKVTQSYMATKIEVSKKTMNFFLTIQKLFKVWTL